MLLHSYRAAEAWEECLARRGLAERPGRLELQAPRSAPSLKKGPPTSTQVCCAYVRSCRCSTGPSHRRGEGAVASRSLCALIPEPFAEAKEGRSPFEGAMVGVGGGARAERTIFQQPGASNHVPWGREPESESPVGQVRWMSPGRRLFAKVLG